MNTQTEEKTRKTDATSVSSVGVTEVLWSFITQQREEKDVHVSVTVCA